MKKWRYGIWLTGIIICILIVYVAGENKNRIWDTWKIRIIQSIQECAEQFYLPGITYAEKKKDNISVDEWIAEKAAGMIPLGGYVVGKEKGELSVEDEDTYALLMKMQAEDENSVDENGNLVGEDNSSETKQQAVAEIDMSKLSDYDYLVSSFYTVDSSTYLQPSDLNTAELLAKNMKIETGNGEPKVLIFHTHSQETFADSDGTVETSIVGVGRYLTEVLNNKYQIPTMHHEGVYDLIDGKLDRSEAYEMARPEIQKILADNPSIEVVIDLHRDGVADTTHLVTEVNGKQTAQIMFFNGMSRTRTNGELAGMENPYRQENLAFSLQMKLAAETKYPGFARRNYLRGYKYNMDLAPKMLLVEAGAQTNTVGEMRNAMEVLADLLNEVINEP